MYKYIESVSKPLFEDIPVNNSIKYLFDQIGPENKILKYCAYLNEEFIPVKLIRLLTGFSEEEMQRSINQLELYGVIALKEKISDHEIGLSLSKEAMSCLKNVVSHDIYNHNSEVYHKLINTLNKTSVISSDAELYIGSYQAALKHWQKFNLQESVDIAPLYFRLFLHFTSITLDAQIAEKYFNLYVNAIEASSPSPLPLNTIEDIGLMNNLLGLCYIDEQDSIKLHKAIACFSEAIKITTSLNDAKHQATIAEYISNMNIAECYINRLSSINTAAQFNAGDTSPIRSDQELTTSQDSDSNDEQEMQIESIRPLTQAVDSSIHLPTTDDLNIKTQTFMDAAIPQLISWAASIRQSRTTQTEQLSSR